MFPMKILEFKEEEGGAEAVVTDENADEGRMKERAQGKRFF